MSWMSIYCGSRPEGQREGVQGESRSSDTEDIHSPDDLELR